MPNGMLLRCSNPACDHSVMTLLGTGSLAQEWMRNKNYDLILNAFTGTSRQKVQSLLDQEYTIIDLPNLPFYCPDCNLIHSSMLCMAKKGVDRQIVTPCCPECGKETPYAEFSPQSSSPFIFTIRMKDKTINYHCPKCNGDTFTQSPMLWD